MQRSVHLHAMHEERAVPGDHHHPPARRLSFRAAESHPDAGSEAVAHAAHAQRDREPALSPHRQVVNGRRAGVAGINDDVHFVGQCVIELGHGVVVAHTRAVESRRGQLRVRHHIGHPNPGGPPRAGKRKGQHPQGRTQIVGVHVGAGEIRRRRPDGNRSHRRQCIVETGARGHR